MDTKRKTEAAVSRIGEESPVFEADNCLKYGLLLNGERSLFHRKMARYVLNNPLRKDILGGNIAHSQSGTIGASRRL